MELTTAMLKSLGYDVTVPIVRDRIKWVRTLDLTKWAIVQVGAQITMGAEFLTADGRWVAGTPGAHVYGGGLIYRWAHHPSMTETAATGPDWFDTHRDEIVKLYGFEAKLLATDARMEKVIMERDALSEEIECLTATYKETRAQKVELRAKLLTAFQSLEKEKF